MADFKHDKYAPGEMILSREQIEESAVRIGKQITADYEGKEVILVGILSGCVMWMAEIMKSIELDIKVDFMSVSSYGSATRSSGVVKIAKDLSSDIKGCHALIVEDIIDSGVTLDYLCHYLRGREPASLKICAMLDKPSGRRVDISADYVGFVVPDAFLVGYGLDAAQRYRNLPNIATLQEKE